MTKDVQEFKNKVGNAQLTGNIDSPEGGLDALAQALLCDGKEHEDGNLRFTMINFFQISKKKTLKNLFKQALQV